MSQTAGAAAERTSGAVIAGAVIAQLVGLGIAISLSLGAWVSAWDRTGGGGCSQPSG